MKSFKVSIILPVYNVEKYLSACLDSLLAQTLEEIEIVAVNDGSTDRSLQILQAYQSLNPEKLFIFSTENHGVSRARNYGFAHSHGEYVWFVDSDDFVEPDACRLLYEKATADGNDLVLFRYYNVDSETGIRKEYIASCHNQNFRVADKPYELNSHISLLIHRSHRKCFQSSSYPDSRHRDPRLASKTDCLKDPLLFAVQPVQIIVALLILRPAFQKRPYLALILRIQDHKLCRFPVIPTESRNPVFHF